MSHVENATGLESTTVRPIMRFLFSLYRVSVEAEKGFFEDVADEAKKLVTEPESDHPDWSALAGNDADVNETTFEPPYDEITSADQVQIYESIMENSDGRITYTLLRGAACARDNRLLPTGFDKATADANIAAHGAAVDDDDFVGGADEVTYLVPVSPTAGPFTVAVELLYQSISSSFAADIRKDVTFFNNTFGDMYDAAHELPTTIATAEIIVE